MPHQTHSEGFMRTHRFPMGPSQHRRRQMRLFRSVRQAIEALEPRMLLSTIVVSSVADSGNGSLRAAINQANTDPGSDIIQFATSGTIKLNSNLPSLTDDTQLLPTTKIKVTIDGNKLYSIFAIS